MISLLRNNFYLVISYRREFKRKRERRIIVYGSANRLPTQAYNDSLRLAIFIAVLLNFKY